MKPITISLPVKNTQSYNIWIGTELFASLTKYFPKGVSCSSIVIITDHTVKKLYAVSLQKHLETAGFRSFIFSFPAGERYKTAETKAALEQKMFQKKCDRNTLILAVGGGVAGDLAGFVAATYMRGIAYLQIPTSLLAMIDSSVGGKTGINTQAGKNLIGAFWQPKAVIADLSLLGSLPQKHLQNGLFEAVKIFLTCNQKFFSDFERNLPFLLKRDVKILTRIIQHAVQLKAQIVCQDEHEQNLRMILNFGHTIGHAIEQLSGYKILHGFAVGLGMLVEAKIAELLGWLSKSTFEQIFIVLTGLGIDVNDLKKFSVTKIIQLTQLDKKTKQQQVKYILLNAIGSVNHANNQYAHAVPDQIVRQALLILQRQ
jgi:3-dehydroquinate synthase